MWITQKDLEVGIDLNETRHYLPEIKGGFPISSERMVLVLEMGAFYCQKHALVPDDGDEP